MRKILMLSVLAAVSFTACKKQEDTVSRVVTVSYPLVKLTSQQYYSFPVGGGPLPTANNIKATAVDTFYHETLTPVVDASTLSSLVGGLFTATISAKNSYGFVGYNYVYVAVTDVADTVDISGTYVRRISGTDSAIVKIMKMANGLYRSNNIAGVVASNPGFIIPGYFVMNVDQVTLMGNTQPSSLGTFDLTNAMYDNTTSDTTISYVVADNSNFGSSTRVFHKMQ